MIFSVEQKSKTWSSRKEGYAYAFIILGFDNFHFNVSNYPFSRTSRIHKQILSAMSIKLLTE